MNAVDTIFAVASGSGKAAVKICRISGTQAWEVAHRMGLEPLRPRTASLRRFRRPDTGEELDAGLALWFPGPSSFSGEDLLELHFHGGLAVQKAILNALSGIAGCRLAEPGEFTWRAFLNGKMDLTSAEGLADLIDADTELQRRQALRQAHGTLYEKAAGWRDALLTSLAEIEAEIDFEDEPDVPQANADRITAAAEKVRTELEAALRDFSRGEVTRDGYCVMIMGPPNAGKSSLLNHMARRDAAIVSSWPGTTRDLLEIRLDLDGAPVVLVDTAGFRDSSDELEQIGIGRALVRAREAQLILWLTEDGRGPRPGLLPDAPILVVQTKADLPTVKAPAANHAISVVTGYGLDRLIDDIAALAGDSLGALSPALLTNARQFSAVSSAAARLGSLVRVPQPELLAEELRIAAQSLEMLIGRIDCEDVLGAIFSRFCIGK